MGCIGKMTGEFRERMYGVLDLYEKPYDADQPVVCLDEKPITLHACWDA